MPAVTVSLFENKLRISGPNLRYTLPLDKWSIILGAGLVNDDAMLELFGDQKSFRKSRDTSFEGLLGIAYQPLRILGIQASVAQDFIEHHGHYVELQALLDVGVILRHGNAPLAIFKIVNKLGAGSRPHNRYLYGVGANRVISNYQVGLQIISPQLFPNIYARLESTYFSILGPDQRNALLVRDKKDGIQGSALITYKFF